MMPKNIKLCSTSIAPAQFTGIQVYLRMQAACNRLHKFAAAQGLPLWQRTTQTS